MGKSDSKLYLQTTEVPAAKSIGEITAVLVNAGAHSIQTLYGECKPTGLEWSMMLYGRPVYFRLPVKVEPVYAALKQQAGGGFVGRDRDMKMRQQAERIAWRQMLAWVRVQMSLVQLGMVEYAEVFLPYVQDQPGGKTMWEVAAATQFKALPAPERKQ